MPMPVPNAVVGVGGVGRGKLVLTGVAKGCVLRYNASRAGMVKRYHASFPSLSYGFNSRYPLHKTGFFAIFLQFSPNKHKKPLHSPQKPPILKIRKG